MPVFPGTNQVDFGSSSGNGQLFLGVPPTAGIEVHVPVGTGPKGPQGDPNVKATQAGFTSSGAPVAAIKIRQLCADGTLIRVSNPA